MHGKDSKPDFQETLNFETFFKNLKGLFKTPGSHRVVVIASLVWLVLVVFLHFLGRAGAWSMILLNHAAILLVDAFTLITLQEYTDGVIREATDVKKTLAPLNSFAIIFRSFALVQTLHVGSWFLCVVIYLPSLLYEFGLLRRFPSKDINVNTLWKDAESLKKEGKFKVGFQVLVFFIIVFCTIAALLGGSVKGVMQKY
jgi:hypothetical protein